MPNTSVPAAAEGVPATTMLNRRLFLSKVPPAALAATALAGLSANAAQPAGIQSLIEAHLAAVAFADTKWCAYGEVSDAHPDVDGMVVRVQRGRLLLPGKDDEGNDRWKPLYATDEQEIDEDCDRHRDAMLSIWGRGPGGEKRAEEIRDKAEARRTRLKGGIL